jgi:hypothetical protein
VPDWFDGGGSGSPVDVRALLDDEAVGALWDVVQLGALVSFGTTSDGGTLGITITVDGRWRRTYVRDADDLATFVSEALPAVASAVQAGGASSARGKRSRRP